VPCAGAKSCQLNLADGPEFFPMAAANVSAPALLCPKPEEINED
jgi:hypothetical protein